MSQVTMVKQNTIGIKINMMSFFLFFFFFFLFFSQDLFATFFFFFFSWWHLDATSCSLNATLYFFFPSRSYLLILCLVGWAIIDSFTVSFSFFNFFVISFVLMFLCWISSTNIIYFHFHSIPSLCHTYIPLSLVFFFLVYVFLSRWGILVPQKFPQCSRGSEWI